MDNTTNFAQLLLSVPRMFRLVLRHVRAGALASMTLGGALESELLRGGGLPRTDCPHLFPFLIGMIPPMASPFSSRVGVRRWVTLR